MVFVGISCGSLGNYDNVISAGGRTCISGLFARNYRLGHHIVVTAIDGLNHSILLLYNFKVLCACPEAEELSFGEYVVEYELNCVVNCLTLCRSCICRVVTFYNNGKFFKDVELHTTAYVVCILNFNSIGAIFGDCLNSEAVCFDSSGSTEAEIEVDTVLTIAFCHVFVYVPVGIVYVIKYVKLSVLIKYHVNVKTGLYRCRTGGTSVILQMDTVRIDILHDTVNGDTVYVCGLTNVQIASVFGDSIGSCNSVTGIFTAVQAIAVQLTLYRVCILDGIDGKSREGKLRGSVRNG